MFKIRTVPSKNSRLKENGAGRGAGRVERDAWSGTLLKTFIIGITSLGYVDKGTRKE